MFPNSGDYHEEFGQATEDLLMSAREEGNPIIAELEKHLAGGDEETAEGKET